MLRARYPGWRNRRGPSVTQHDPLLLQLRDPIWIGDVYFGAVVAEELAFGFGYGVADGVGAVAVGLDEAHVGDGRGFGHAVSLGDLDAGEFGEAARELGRERRGAGFGVAHMMVARELAGFRGVAEGVHHRWDHGEPGDALARDEVAGAVHVEARH